MMRAPLLVAIGVIAMAALAIMVRAATFTVPLSGTAVSVGTNNVVLLDGNLQRMDAAGVGNFAIFTGTQAGPTYPDTLIANLSTKNPPSGSVTFAMSTACGPNGDNAAFHIVGTAGQWTNTARVGPFLMSNGFQNGKTTGQGGFQIAISGTDSSGTFCTPITLGDPPYNLPSGKSYLTVTSTIQNAINAANTNQVVFIPSSFGGNFTMKNGVDVVSATGQNHINGQTARANVGCVGTANNATLYGVSTNCEVDIFGNSNFSLINNIVHDTGAQGYRQDNDTNTIIKWNTFTNISGNNNPGDENSTQGMINASNACTFTQAGCEGAAADQAGNNTYQFNFYYKQNQAGVAGGSGGIGGFEIANTGSVSNRIAPYHILDNFCVHDGGPPGVGTFPQAGFCWSLVGSWNLLDFERNACESPGSGGGNGGGCSLERQNDISAHPGGKNLIIGNNFAANNECPGNGCPFGQSRCFWGAGPDLSGTGSQLTNNRVITYADSYMCSVEFQGESGNGSIGAPIPAGPFAAGAGP